MKKRFDYKRVVAHGHPRADRDGHVKEHKVIAERAIGRYLPLGAEIHHVDENPLNNANSNLVICQDRAYHKLLHKRARIVRAGGNPNTQRICSSCKQIKDVCEFNRRADDYQTACRWCQARYQRGKDVAA